MSNSDTLACFKEPAVLLEQFIPDHVFVYIISSEIRCFDGRQSYRFREGEVFLARKNRLAKYYYDRKSTVDRLVFCFEESFLRNFQQKFGFTSTGKTSDETFIKIDATTTINRFLESHENLRTDIGPIKFNTADHENLLSLILQNHPSLAGILFNYTPPAKINLEEFMNRNFRFNVSLRQFAFLTGRSLTAFKRDFEKIFSESPGRWLVAKRLQEAWFLIENEKKKASEIYLELGFEDLSHFSLAFKKLFGLRPTEVVRKQNDQ